MSSLHSGWGTPSAAQEVISIEDGDAFGAARWLAWKKASSREAWRERPWRVFHRPWNDSWVDGNILYH
ncbi:MAG: hypothetical protein ABIW76_07790 [Fibrobacteria bacterium]